MSNPTTDEGKIRETRKKGRAPQTVQEQKNLPLLKFLGKIKGGNNMLTKELIKRISEFGENSAPSRGRRPL